MLIASELSLLVGPVSSEKYEKEIGAVYPCLRFRGDSILHHIGYGQEEVTFVLAKRKMD